MRDVKFDYFYASDGAKIEYIDLGGEGQPFVLMHGFGSEAQRYLPVMRMFEDRFHVAGFTQRGFGGRDGIHEGSEDKGELGMKRSAQDLKEFIEHMGFDHIVMMGYSMGASVVLSYLDQFGTKYFDKLIIGDITPKLRRDETWPYGIYQGNYTDEMYEHDMKLMDEDFIAFNKYYQYQAFLPHTPDEPRDNIYTEKMYQEFSEMAKGLGVTAEAMLDVPKKAWHVNKAYFKSLYEEDFRASGTKVDIPSCVIAAVPGSVFDPRAVEYISAQMRGSKFYRIMNASHTDPIQTRIPELAADIYDFLDNADK